MDYLCVMLFRILRITMVFVYLLGAVGFSMRTHFCGEVLDSIHLFADNVKEDPCECIEFGSTDCCKDVLVKSSNPSAQVLTNLTKSPNPWVFNQKLFFAFENHFFKPTASTLVWNKYDGDSPPCLSPQLCKLSIYRI
ncbi:MAG: hypothetical protein SGJ00_02725 [bacterium]|nr:hypothetical protein [bacterium]